MLSISLFYLSTLWTLSLAISRLPDRVIAEMSTREMRHHHLLWHNIRNSWLSLDNDTKKALESLGWDCPRPSQRNTSDGRTMIIEDNGSGEDFLYMHRQIIEKAHEICSELDPPFEMTGWDNFPLPNDTTYPVPPAYDGGSKSSTETIKYWKEDDIYWNFIKPKEAKFKDPEYLRNVTLGKLGAQIEFGFHNGLHIRYSAKNLIGMRSKPSNPVPEIDEKWDDPHYDWLFDTYAAHLNPYFYKFHIWIDDRIQDWMAVNNVTELEWKGTWVGGPISRIPDAVQIGRDHNLKVDGDEIPAPNLRGAHDMHMHGHHMGDSDSQGATVNVLEEVMEILSKAGVKEYAFYDPIWCEGEEVLPSP